TPAAFGELRVGIPEAGRRGDVARFRVVPHAVLVAGGVQRRQHRLAEAGGLLEHGVDGVTPGVGEAEVAELRFRAEDVVEDEADVVQRGLVLAHVRVRLSCVRQGEAGAQRITPGSPGTGLSWLS